MVNTNMHVFKHPNYYKELRKRNRSFLLRKEECTTGKLWNKSDQVISNAEATAASERAPGQGLRSYPLSGNGGKLDSLQTLADKTKAPSFKHQASSPKLLKHQATSVKPQAASVKLKPTSVKLHDS